MSKKIYVMQCDCEHERKGLRHERSMSRALICPEHKQRIKHIIFYCDCGSVAKVANKGSSRERCHLCAVKIARERQQAKRNKNKVNRKVGLPEEKTPQEPTIEQIIDQAIMGY